ncbi:MAG: adenylosuccinate synthase [Bacteroidales bacterium]
MKIDILLGLQWGDEGKGKIVDVLTPDYDIIARFQGGPNAGHTLEFNNVKHILHLIPSGIFREGKINIIGNGVVIDPAIFKAEVEKTGLPRDEIKRRLYISLKSHLILPGHRMLDAASEMAKGEGKIGSTLKGIGPAYTDKAGRNGIRTGDILSSGFSTLYNKRLEEHLALLKLYGAEFNVADYEKGWFEGIELIKEFNLINSEYYINDALANGKSILAEGAQGTLLDVDFGSYPFVTSSNTIAAGACTGLGVPPRQTGEVFGIFKAYCTRVGSGPFPTELHDHKGEQLRKQGHEFGSTTGRPRRCGWLDLPALRYAIMLNGVTRLFMMKSDVLTGLSTISVCKSYTINGKTTGEMPYDQSALIEPNYTKMPGWREDITGIREFEKLPIQLQDYTKMIEDETGVPVTIISTGPDREQTIFRK